MVRETTDGVTLTSIALLQERFRQLQKMKERRQEKELLRMLSETDQRYSPPVLHYEPRSKTILASELMFLPPKPHCQLSLSLWPNSQIKNADSWGLETPSNLAKSWFNDHAPLVCGTLPIKLQNSDISDVDTSLHL